MASCGGNCSHLNTGEDHPGQPSDPAADSHFQDRLMEHGPELLKRIDMKPLKAYLLKYKVVDEIAWQSIEIAGPNFAQVDSLICHIKRGDIRRYKSFIQSLRDTDQGHVADMLDPQTSPPARDHDRLLKEIGKHCKVYLLDILTIPHLDMDDDEPFDLSPCLIDIKMFVETQKQGGLIDIPTDKIFDEFNGKPSPHTVLISGAAGCGKSTFLRGHIFNWAKEHLEQRPEMKIIIFIPATSIKHDVWTSIDESLPTQNQELCDFVHSDGENVFLFIDGIDGVRNQEILRNIEHFIRECKEKGSPKVLVTTRENLAGVKKIQFNRHLQITGFTEEQSLQYIMNFLGDDHPAFLQHIEGRKHSPEIRDTLKNPLRLHILCTAVKHGLLNDVSNLKITHLYDCIETIVNARDAARYEHGELPEDLQTQNKRFHLMCLYSILKSKSTISTHLLECFSICKECPMLRLLTKKKAGINVEGKTRYVYTPLHESYIEYSASKGILSLNKTLRQVLLMYICSKTELMNLQLMIYGSLALHLKDEIQNATQVQELISMMMYIILLQTVDAGSYDGEGDESGGLNVTLIQTAVHLIKDFEALVIRIDSSGNNLLLKVLLANNAALITCDMLGMWERLNTLVNAQFDRPAGGVKLNAKLSQTFHPHIRVHGGHIHQCLDQCLPWQLPLVADNTLGCILPLRDNEGDEYYQIPGTSRWGMVDTLHTMITWTPSDALRILDHVTPPSSHHPPSLEPASPESPPPDPRSTEKQLGNEMVFYCGLYADIFGKPPATAFSQACWAELLTAPTLCDYRSVTIDLGYLSFPSAAHPDLESESSRILPVLQALLSSSYTHTSNTRVKEVRVNYGHILQSELQPMLRELDRLVEAGRMRIVLKQPDIVIDESTEDVSRQEEMKKIKHSGYVRHPQWFTPQGEEIKYRKDTIPRVVLLSDESG